MILNRLIFQLIPQLHLHFSHSYGRVMVVRRLHAASSSFVINNINKEIIELVHFTLIMRKNNLVVLLGDKGHQY